ncbi:MAG: peptide chain release factor N(5)-glutamine methyltransferase [Pseudomonadales bacterium]|nr:peptide chain release factor N(5)-glutamine methyltransferase [Pseudomonadales bacterium]
MVTIKQALMLACRLEGLSETARLDVEVLLAHVTGRDKAYLYTWPDRELTSAQQQAFESLFAQRQTGIPVAYLVGVKEFWSLPMKVNPSTLIPRPDTELLVQRALKLLAADSPQTVADLGTGTGAIALAIAKERPRWKVLGCDMKAEIVSLAEQNRQMLGLPNVGFVVSDWCRELPKHAYDLILSNPPYIAPDDPHLQSGDIRFEPTSALVSEEDGLRDIATIVDQAKEHLKPQGFLLLEHGWKQAKRVQGILSAAGYSAISTCQDLAGLDRVTQCQWPGDDKR